LSVYLEILKKSFKQLYVYKLNTYISILSAIFAIFVQISIWFALLKDRGSIDGVSFQDMVIFVVINMVVMTLTSSDIGEHFAQKVQDGSICLDLIRPINLKYFMLAEQLGANCYHLVFRSLPVCLIAAILLQMKIPGFISSLLFLISMINGLILIYLINYLAGMLAIWFKTSMFMDWFLHAFFSLFAGTVVPLWFYPDFLRKISGFLPFHLVSFEPISIFLGKLDLSSSVRVIMMQIIWIVLCILLERFMWARAQKKIIVHGG
jgi:ABC-2 type transport system permease protein